MNIHFTPLKTAALLVFILFASSLSAQTGKWSTAYYAGWSQGYNNSGLLPAQNIDFGAVTHINHFAIVPRADGSLDDASNSVTAYNANAVVTAAHAAGKKVLITVGGFYTDGSFRGATSSANRTTFVNNLVTLMRTRGYDGIDVDWEPLESGDAAQFVAFITQLRTAMDAVSPRPLLTAATAWGAPIFAQVKDKFDQINLMSYDLAGAWPGWVTWHNSPLYDGGFTFPSTGNPPPSSDGMIDDFIAAGIPASKLGIGIDFYGYVWSGGDGTPTGGATAPRQSWSSAPSVQANVPYSTIMDTYYQSQYYRFDNATGVSYLSIDNSGSANDKFISYDDEATIQAKVNYTKTKGIGGVIVWELGGGYRANQPAGQKDLLLQALKQALGSVSVPDVTLPTVALTSPLNGAAIAGITVIAASASDNIGVTGVQFKVDGTNIGTEVTVPPYTASLNVASLSAGTHTISATARDAAGNTGTSAVTVTVAVALPDRTAPSVSLTAPVNNAAVSGTISISANASDNVGVEGVQFIVDGANLGGEDITAPYTVPLNTSQLSNGAHAISAVARDAAGNRTTASVSVNVSNAPAGSTSDHVVYADVLASPWINSSWSAAVTFNSSEQVYAGTGAVKAALSAAWGGLSFHYGNWGTTSSIAPSQYKSFDVALYALSAGTQFAVFAENDLGQSFPSVAVGAVPAGQWTVVSVPMVQLSPNGQIIHRISIQEVSGTAKTFYADNIRFTGTSSVIVPPAPDTVKPTVSFASPTNGSTVTGVVAVSANASDNRNIAGVRFMLDGNALGQEVTAAPYAISWNTGTAVSGAHTVTVVARDSSGNQSSVSLTVTVSNTVPAAAGQMLFDDSLRYPWMNISWGSVITFGSLEQKYTGTRSIKIVQNAWGCIRLHNGPWGKPVGINTAVLTQFDFAVHGGTDGLSLNIWFENDNNGTFPVVKNIAVPANGWKTVSIPVSQLNPGNLTVHTVVIQDVTGKKKTLYIDDLRFTAGGNEYSKADRLSDADMITAVPSTFNLEQNFPNPFNPSTSIRYSLAAASHVRIEIFNEAGQEVSVLVNGLQPSGEHGVTFEAGNNPSGVYFYRLTAFSSSEPNGKPMVMTKKMVLVK